MKKIYILAAVAQMSLLSARAEVTVKISEINDNSQLMGEAMSPDGKYVVGANYATFTACVWDVENNAYYTFAEAEENSSFHASSNNGLFVGESGQKAVCATKDGEWKTLWYNEGEQIYNEEFDFWYTTGDAGSSAYAVTEDGEPIFGFYYNAEYYTKPCYWRNGERVDLPLPTAEELGFEISGGEVRWCTPDGKLLLGFVMDNYNTWPACVWRQNEDGTYTCNPICKDYFEADYGNGKPYMLFCPYGLSENGEWVSISLQAEYDAFNWADPTPIQMARMNLNSGELQVLGEELDQATIPGCIANDGSMFYILNALMGIVGREARYWAAGAEQSISMAELTGEVEELQGLICNTPCAISADGKTIQGFGMTEATDIFSYVLSLGGVVSLNEMEAPQSKVMFNLFGQKVNDANGVVLLNGRKMMVK